MTLRLVPAVLAAFALSVPAIAQDAPVETPVAGSENLSLTQTTALRCSAAFAIISGFQDDGQALEYPILRTRGREFFVQIAARIMDDTGIDRDGITQLMGREVRGFADKDELKEAMPACLLLLEASGV